MWVLPQHSVVWMWWSIFVISAFGRQVERNRRIQSWKLSLASLNYIRWFSEQTTETAGGLDQKPHGSAELSVSTVPGDLTPPSDLRRHCMQMVHIFTCRQTCIHIKTNKRILSAQNKTPSPWIANLLVYRHHHLLEIVPQHQTPSFLFHTSIVYCCF